MLSEQQRIFRICAYGTLRQHNENYWKIVKNYGSNAYKFKSKVTIPGYNMYDLIYYPAIVVSDNPEDKIVAELYDCDYHVYWHIRNMESNAGYHEELVYVDDIPYSIFAMTLGQIPDPPPLIESGDWRQHVDELCKFNC